MRRIPPLAAVRVFEAAGRHENFTTAAAELGMTQAAVSYQIKVLEERLGLALFRREKRRVVLTEPGRRALAQVSGAFDALDGAFAGLRAEDEGLLTVSTSMTFANEWLAWRLGGFQIAHPDIAVRLLVSDALVDFAADDVDVVVRSGMGDWPELAADRLFEIDFTPMCSPAFLADHGGTLTPSDLLTLPIISPQDSWWAVWLGEAGIGAMPAPRRGGVRLDTQTHEGAAAMAGQGMGILTPLLWRRSLAEGVLVRPFAQVSSRGHAYWFAVPERRRRVPKIARFREWLMTEIAADRALLA